MATTGTAARAVTVSRRGLFSLGLARVIPDDEHFAALGAAWQGYRDGEAGVERTDFPALAERARAIWGTGDPQAAEGAHAPAAATLVQEAGVAAGQTVLDVGAGTGTVALAAAALGASITALDASPALVGAGRARCERAGADVAWRLGDAEALPFPDAAFDCVVSSFGAMFAPRPRLAAAELARVARPGGVVALTAWSCGGFMGRALDVATALSPARADVARPSRWGRYESAFLWLGSVVEEFEVTDHVLALPYASRAEAVRALLAAPGPLAAAVREASPPDRERALATLAELVDAFARSRVAGTPAGTGAPVEIPAVYTVVRGRAPT